MLKKLRGYFLSGLVILAPIFFTVLVLSYLVRLADRFVVNPVFRLLPGDFVGEEMRTLAAKLLIAVAVIVFVTALGIATREFLFRRLLEAGEGMLENIPVFNKLYRSFKEIMRAIFGEKNGGIFKRVVCVHYPSTGVYILGFVTKEDFAPLSDKIGGKYVNVFVPSPPNPATGYSVLVPSADVIELDMTVEDAIKYSISCGGFMPPALLK